MVNLCSPKNRNAYEQEKGLKSKSKLCLETLFKQKTKMDFSAYYKKNRPSLVWYLQRFTNNPYTAEDVADEAFVKALEELERYDSQRAQFSTWLYTIAKRLMYQNSRYESKFHNVTAITNGNGDDSELTLDEAISYHVENSDLDTLEEETKLEKQSSYATDTMSKLPEKYSRVLTMRLIDGLSYQEISDYLNINLSTVKSQVRNGKVLLKESLINKFGCDTLYSMAA